MRASRSSASYVARQTIPPQLTVILLLKPSSAVDICPWKRYRSNYSSKRSLPRYVRFLILCSLLPPLAQNLPSRVVTPMDPRAPQASQNRRLAVEGSCNRAAKRAILNMLAPDDTDRQLRRRNQVGTTLPALSATFAAPTRAVLVRLGHLSFCSGRGTLPPVLTCTLIYSPSIFFPLERFNILSPSSKNRRRPSPPW